MICLQLKQIDQNTMETDKTDCANFYIGDMACRAMDDVRRNAGLKYREQDEEEKPLGGGTPSGMGRDTIPDN